MPAALRTDVAASGSRTLGAAVSSRAFFACSLLLPAIGAVIGHLIPRLEFLAVYFWGGLIPYLPVAIVLATWIFRARSLRALLWLSAAAPVAFGLIFGVYIELISYAPAAHLSGAQRTVQFLSSAGLGCGVACCYVGASWLAWLLGRRLGWISNEFAAG